MAEPFLISYVQAYTRHNVTFDATASVLRVRLPRTAAQRRAFFIGGALFVAFISLQLVANQNRGSELIPVFITYAVMFAVYVVICGRLLRPIKIRIDSVRATFENLPLTNDPNRDAVRANLSRPAIYRVYYVDHARAIFFRAHGEQMVEIPTHYGDAASEALATDFRRWLGLQENDGAETTVRAAGDNPTTVG